MTAKKETNSAICWICGKSVELEVCVTDEHGLAVHEVCYSTKSALTEKTRPGKPEQTSLRRQVS